MGFVIRVWRRGWIWRSHRDRFSKWTDLPQGLTYQIAQLSSYTREASPPKSAQPLDTFQTARINATRTRICTYKTPAAPAQLSVKISDLPHAYELSFGSVGPHPTPLHGCWETRSRYPSLAERNSTPTSLESTSYARLPLYQRLISYPPPPRY